MPDTRDIDNRIFGDFIMEFGNSSSQAEYQAGESEKLRYIEPHVSLIDDLEEVRYNRCIVLMENCEVWEAYKEMKATCNVPMTHEDYVMFRENIIKTAPLREGGNFSSSIGTAFYKYPIKNDGTPSDTNAYSMISAYVDNLDYEEGEKTVGGYNNMSVNPNYYGYTNVSILFNEQYCEAGDAELVYYDDNDNRIPVRPGKWFIMKTYAPSK